MKRRYVVYEFVTAWSEWEVEARSKAEAIAIVKRGEAPVNESSSDSSGPNGRYRVFPISPKQQEANR